jgi:hypothetical protein
MKTKKELLKVFNEAKGEHLYYSFEDFMQDAKNFIKDVKYRNTYCTIKPSKSGMSRKFNFNKYNCLLNICYNGKFEWKNVPVSGCVMDMHWYLKYSVCERLMTKKELEKHNINYLCSSGIIL